MNALYLANSVNKPERAAVIELSIDRNQLGALSTLAFVFGDSEWRDFVKHCHSGVRRHWGSRAGDYYDVVYGLSLLPQENGGNTNN